MSKPTTHLRHDISEKRNDILLPLVEDIKSLVQAAETADTAAENFVSDYDREIAVKVGKIDLHVRNLNTTRISDCLEEVFTQVNPLLGKLKAQLAELSSSGQKVTSTVGTGLSAIEAELTKQISSLKGQIRSNISSYVTSTLPSKINEKLTTFTDFIVDSKNGINGHLDEIAHRVLEYAGEFKEGMQNGFEATVEKWINDIMSKEPVRSKLDKYVRVNKEKGTLKDGAPNPSARKLSATKLMSISNGADELLRTPIITTIKSQLDPEIKNAVKAFGADSTNKIEENLQKVKKVCETFYGSLNHKFSTVRFDTLVTNIVKAVEQEVLGKSHKSALEDEGYIDTELQFAVEAILPALYATAKQTAATIERLNEGDTIKLGENVQAAIDRVKLLGTRLKDALTPDATRNDKLGTDINTVLGNEATKDDFNKPLSELLSKAAKQGINMLDEKVKRIVSIDLRDAHPTMETQINRLKQIQTTDQPDNIRQKVETLGRQITALKELVSGVHKKAKGIIRNQVGDVKGRIEELKSNVSNINDRIIAYNQALERDIQETERAVSTARQQLEREIATTETHLTSEVNTAFTAVHTAAKTMFNQSHKEDLERLKELVSAQHAAITEIINEDKETGLKGLMKKMYDKDGATLNELKDYNEPKNPEHFENLSKKFQEYLKLIFDYINEQIKPSDTSPPNSTTKEPTKMLSDVQSKLETLLKNLGTSKHFDNVFVTHLESFSTELGIFTPSHFAGPQNAKLLDSLRDGLQKLRDQLDKAYVSAYSGDYINNHNKDKCANAFVTCLPTINRDLWKLKYGCKNSWKFNRIYDSDSESLGAFLKGCDYTVSTDADKQDGELKNDNNNMLGANVAFLLTKDTKLFKKTSQNDSDVLQKLVDHIKSYNQVGHVKHIPSPRTPCSIYEMLTWCTGLQYNSVYDKLVAYCNDYDTKDDAYLSYRLSIAVTYQLPSLSTYSHDLLTTILGTGDEHTTYASDFANNSLEFNYPASPAACLDTLLDILRRLFPVFRYMLRQCKFSAQHAGWSDCEYGRDIALAKWPCKAHPTAKPNGQSTMKPNGQSTTEPTCQPTSPLMSYLNDCLPGQLPHQLISVGCTAKCITCSPGSRECLV
ncbi:hypothetical protein, conserved [Babesia ovata]|uniref:Extracellular matrix-binding ebh n=1 Tax=Babesia ovata TaxID=189622 RepID=A0A2H6KJ80_9APIC|nr:uncharacterized protein BOVATA_045220 [Babesia ovata]GBE63029.1 hypothetical protein, conserved [Babesia ovata]